MGVFKEISVIGLTGQSGAGKSTVSAILRAEGLAVLDADAISKRVSAKESFLKEVKRFFPECVSDSGLDRRAAASIVFNSPEKMRLYESLIFPYITKMIFSEIKRLSDEGEKIVVLDAPTLFESGLDKICDMIISVVAPMDVKIRRILERDGIPLELVTSRLSSQKSEDFFELRSDYVIENSSDFNELERKAAFVAEKIKERFND